MEFSELNAEERSYFDDSRLAVVKFAQSLGRLWPPADPDEGVRTLQLIHDAKLYDTVRYYQALSICLGDLMSMTSPLKWIHLEHDNGGGAFLQWKETDIALNVLIAFEKRVAAGEEIDVQNIFNGFIERAIEIEKAELE
jgi:hypothetical protein